MTTFIKITNQEIYEKLCDVEKRVIQTNGKVKANTKYIYALSAGLLSLTGWFITYLIRGG